ncbi:hypothetical protein PUMCH_004453 [Australozyma saopauloensis]|uniref:SUR7 family protein FMP45 n=1 Tax=Australozyma saopauloensis TaxID=291208 RepID=A0AAX4HFI0_9ASCO|nr:hypothetical protein PUMCH_004453 [[Candida] saopauloensis]
MKLINTILNLVLLAGTTLLLVFILLSGSTDHFPFNTFYSVRANTSAIQGAFQESAWTFWGVCDYLNWQDCKVGPAYPISPVDNFNTSEGVPTSFINNRDTYYYLSRFAFAFLLVGLGFTAFALLVDMLGLCFTVIDKVVIVLVTIALFFTAGFASFSTAATVMAKNAFSLSDMAAKVGVKYMAMTWAAFACILLVFFNTCAANIATSYRKHIERVNESKQSQAYYQSAPAAADNNAVLGDESSFTRDPALTEKDDAGSGGIRFFRIKRNHKTADDESV